MRRKTEIALCILFTLLLACISCAAFQMSEATLRRTTFVSGKSPNVSVESSIVSLGSSDSASDWPMFHNDPMHTGYSTSNAPGTNQTIWSCTLSLSPTARGSGLYSSPAIVDGKVYISGNDDHNSLYALDALAGTQIWNFTIDAGSFASCSPAVADGKIYVGGGVVGGDTYLYALDASNGEELWRHRFSEMIRSPVVADGRVYVGSWDCRVYALDASTGTQIWNFTTGFWVESIPAVADGTVYTVSLDGMLYALNASTGTLIWEFGTGAIQLYNSPTVAYDKVFVGSGSVWALDASTGIPLWSFGTGEQWHSSPAVAYGRVFAGSGDNRIYALDASTGTQIWNFTTSGDIESSPAIADGTVYIGSCDGYLYALDASTGENIWSYQTSDEIVCSPAVADGRVYVGSWSGTYWTGYVTNFHAFGGPPILRHDVSVTGVRHSKAVIVTGHECELNISVANFGVFDESFNVTAWTMTISPATNIWTTSVPNLLPGETRIFIFNWNTTGWAYGNYTVGATATNVSGETNTANNVYRDGWVLVTLLGDVNGDRKVDLKDVFAVGKAFGSVVGDPRYNPNLDLNGDGKIDLKDYYTTCKNYGKSW